MLEYYTDHVKGKFDRKSSSNKNYNNNNSIYKNIRNYIRTVLYNLYVYYQKINGYIYCIVEIYIHVYIPYTINYTYSLVKKANTST